MVVTQEKNNKISKLEKKVQYLESILALLPGHVYWLDENNIFQGCNNLQAKSINLSSPKSIVGKKNSDLFSLSFAKKLDVVNMKVLKTGDSYSGEETLDLSNGKRIYLSQKAPINNEDGEIIGLLGVSVDITERKKMEKDLKLAREKADLANQAKTEFIRNLEHDIRTPLCGVKSVTKYLETIEKDVQKKEFLNDIEVATNELLYYLDNIVEFSQIKTGAVPLLVKEFNLEQVIKGIINLEQAASKSKKLKLIFNYSPDIPSIIVSDRFRIHRLLLNLVNNAIKFTDQGSVKIIVDLVKIISSKEILIKIIVEDTGIGIAAKDHKVIYDKFTRCEPSNKGIYKGTGLGLWIVKQFVHDLGGSIELISKLNNGSRFVCCLPLKLP
ncbi:PAS domain-containing sensor histidine kinase [Gammaproteobacteria bacterium]|nr:PAS domain-containing sensor histidine kinase [Gammaproteobacteria bacterium]